MTITWLIRYGHVLSGAFWVGGYALLALIVIPLMRRGANEALTQLTLAAVRALTYAGTLTIFFGVVLITRSRGTAALLRGEWGALIIASLVIAIVLLGIGDGALRPAIRRLAAGGDGRAAQRYAMAGLVLTVLAIGLMTRALYAGS
ncbi:MAG: hypothetical protein OHK0022_08030 [Roseiflexaceae bacterium]